MVAEEGRGWRRLSPGALVCYALGVAGSLVFVLVERRMGADALLALRLFADPTFRSATVGGVAVGAGMFGAIILVRLFLQVVGGADPAEAGLLATASTTFARRLTGGADVGGRLVGDSSSLSALDPAAATGVAFVVGAVVRVLGLGAAVFLPDVVLRREDA